MTVNAEKELREKIPDFGNSDWRRRMGDCIYDFGIGREPTIRRGVQIHEENRNSTSAVSGRCSPLIFTILVRWRCLSRAICYRLLKKGQGYRKIEDPTLLKVFERWDRTFPAQCGRR